MAHSMTGEPEPLDEYIGVNITKSDLVCIKRVMSAMGVKKADAVRMLLRAGAQSSRWNHFDNKGD